MVTLNGHPPSWESFIQIGRKELPKFGSLWDDYVSEEAKVLSKNNLQKPQNE